MFKCTSDCRPHEHKLLQEKLNIVPGRISTVGPKENLGHFLKTQKYFFVLINKLDFDGTNGSLSLFVCIQYSMITNK